MSNKKNPLSNELKTNSRPSGKHQPKTENNQTRKNELSINLKRKIEVKCYPVIAKMTFKQERYDLVSLLKATQNSPKTMPLRLLEYIKREKLWDSEMSSLTEKGKEVIDTGYIDVNESGFYHIWYTNNDPLLGTRPLFIQRDTAFFEPKCISWKNGTDARNSDFKVTKTSSVDVWEEIYDGQKSKQDKVAHKLVSLIPEVICSPENSAELALEWQLGFTQSDIFLNGKLNVLSFSRIKQESSVIDFEHNVFSDKSNISTVLKAIATEFDGFLDEKAQRIGVRLEKMQQYPSAVQHFVIGSRNLSKLKTVFGTFDDARILQLPIKPLNNLDAEQWHQAWLNTYHSKGYHREYDARQQQSIWLDHEAMTDFDLSLKTGQELLDCFRRESNPESYWHVAAMADLSPSCSQKQRLPITLINSDVIDIRELIRKLTAGDSIQSVIYSDRYVYTSKQSRNLDWIASHVEGAKGILMTLKSTKGERDAVLPPNWQKDTFHKRSDNHGRYWIFIGDSHSWCWECTSGLDFIREDNDSLTVDGTPTFIPKEVNELPQYLQHKISTLQTAEVM